nr:hypothetical protein Iba_scaffold970CG0350 [Ipomoea batatas]
MCLKMMDTFFTTVLPFIMKMVVQWIAKALAEKSWIECTKHMIQNWLEKNLHMMVKRVCSQLVHFLETNLSSQLFLRMSLQIGTMVTAVLGVLTRVTRKGYGALTDQRLIRWRLALLPKYL